MVEISVDEMVPNLVISKYEEHLYEHKRNSDERRDSQEIIHAAGARFQLKKASEFKPRINYAANSKC